MFSKKKIAILLILCELHSQYRIENAILFKLVIPSISFVLLSFSFCVNLYFYLSPTQFLNVVFLAFKDLFLGTHLNGKKHQFLVVGSIA